MPSVLTNVSSCLVKTRNGKFVNLWLFKMTTDRHTQGEIGTHLYKYRTNKGVPTCKNVRRSNKKKNNCKQKGVYED